MTIFIISNTDNIGDIEYSNMRRELSYRINIVDSYLYFFAYEDGYDILIRIHLNVEDYYNGFTEEVLGSFKALETGHMT